MLKRYGLEEEEIYIQGAQEALKHFEGLGGKFDEEGLPAIHSPVFTTPYGTPYLKGPGIVMIACPRVELTELSGFLSGFEQVDPTLGFLDYLTDETRLPSATLLCKTAAQGCYMSFGPRRSHNRKAYLYIRNIVDSGHGSVLEHANFTFLLYGISRSLTHELVRHRAGWAYSQESQRYVSGKVLRFVERPEYQNDSELHQGFEERIDRCTRDYEKLAESLARKQEAGETILSAESRTDLRKKVQQCARSLLLNETEAVITVTANIRALRHVISMRANPHAEIEIRELFFRVWLCLCLSDPILFGDFWIETLPDGTYGVKTNYPKV